MPQAEPQQPNWPTTEELKTLAKQGAGSAKVVFSDNPLADRQMLREELSKREGMTPERLSRALQSLTEGPWTFAAEPGAACVVSVPRSPGAEWFSNSAMGKALLDGSPVARELAKIVTLHEGFHCEMAKELMHFGIAERAGSLEPSLLGHLRNVIGETISDLSGAFFYLREAYRTESAEKIDAARDVIGRFIELRREDSVARGSNTHNLSLNLLPELLAKNREFFLEISDEGWKKGLRQSIASSLSEMDAGFLRFMRSR